MFIPVTDIESVTGLSKEVIRKWESRYGFPRPNRDQNGERLYPTEQVERLKLISRLIESGLRPSKVVSLERDALEAMTADLSVGEMAALGSFPRDLFAALKAHHPSHVLTVLQNQMHRQGLYQFVTETVPHLNLLIGDAWLRGEIRVFEEHLFSQCVEDLLHMTIVPLTPPPGSPRILLTTMPGESHVLGLLLARAVLTLHGADCILLGGQTPATEISDAADAFGVKAVGLSFSIAQPARNIARFLGELRGQLPPTIQLWAGGMGAARLNRAIGQVMFIPTFDAALDALATLKKPASPNSSLASPTNLPGRRT